MACPPCRLNVEVRERSQRKKKVKRRRKKKDDDGLLWLFLAFALPKLLKVNAQSGTGTVKVPPTTGTAKVPDETTATQQQGLPGTQPVPAPPPGIPQPPTVDVPPIEVPLPPVVP